MGCSVNASCACGYRVNTLLIGGGMANFMTFCAFPVFCHDCQSLQTANLLVNPPECPQCHSQKVVPYDDDPLKGSDGNTVVESWNIQDLLGRVLQLTNGDYLCPQCKQFTLHFESGGLDWD